MYFNTQEVKKTYIPVLGPKGYLGDPKEKLDQVMAWAYASDYSQSYHYQGKIMSIPYEMQNLEGGLHGVATRLQDKLTNYLNHYFNEVQVQVDVADDYFTNLDGGQEALRGALILRARVTDSSGLTLELHETINKEKSLVRKILNFDPTNLME